MFICICIECFALNFTEKPYKLGQNKLHILDHRLNEMYKNIYFTILNIIFTIGNPEMNEDYDSDMSDSYSDEEYDDDFYRTKKQVINYLNENNFTTIQRQHEWAWTSDMVYGRNKLFFKE